MNEPAGISALETRSDAELVAACVGGDRNAFGPIVERYQRLLCSLAYSATGNLGASEDVAQEAFIEAWKQLRSLREPEKLRPWLCGILRHKIGRLRRSDGREPSHEAAPIKEAQDMNSSEEPAAQLVMRKEEQALLWSELERVPALYREPLVLYYREHGSVEHVAAALDLSEDVVKQRLARGRKILQERVLAFVETALARSSPAKVFTAGVLSVLPALLPAPAKAATAGAVAAHGGTMATTTGLAALLSSATGLAGVVLSLRNNLDQSRTPRERRAVACGILLSFGGSLAFLGLLYALRSAAFHWWEMRTYFAVACFATLVGFAIWFSVYVVAMQRNFSRIRAQERRLHPECFRAVRDQVGASAGEYRSRATFFDVPLLHARFCLPEEGSAPVFGWIALGDRAYGLLFAWGGVAIAPISAGLVTGGLFSVGVVSAGLIALGTLGIGSIAVGATSIGVHASAWLAALGWETAQSCGFASALTAARAPVAFAEQANTPLAQAFFANPHAELHRVLFFSAIALLTLLPMVFYTRAIRRRLGGGTRA